MPCYYFACKNQKYCTLSDHGTSEYHQNDGTKDIDCSNHIKWPLPELERGYAVHPSQSEQECSIQDLRVSSRLGAWVDSFLITIRAGAFNSEFKDICHWLQLFCWSLILFAHQYIMIETWIIWNIGHWTMDNGNGYYQRSPSEGQPPKRISQER